MNWLERIHMRYRSLAHRQREIRGLEDELRYHFDRQVEENEAAGMTPADARRAARLCIGDPAAAREDVTDAWSWHSFELLLRDLRIAARTLVRRPRFAAVAMVVMALGIGATAALFTVVWCVLLKPLPFADTGSLMSVYEVSSDGKFPYNTVAGGVFSAWERENHGFSAMAILHDWPQYDLSQQGHLPEKVRATLCSWNLFPLLGVQPTLGRNFTAADDSLSAPASVILSWGLWKRRFGSDPSIVNRTISLDGKPYTVIGIMPSWFAYPEQSVQLWLPIYHEYGPDMMQPLDAHMFAVVGRLRQGISRQQAVAELSLIVRRLHDTHRDDAFISVGANLRPLLDGIVGEVKAPLYILLAATGCVFLIACLNISNLLVARAASRKKEIAVRAALGGARFRLWREQLAEGVLISAGGGASALLLAYFALRWLVVTRPDLARVEAVQFDGITLAVVGLLAGLCALISAVAASVSTHAGELLSPLRESSRSLSAGASQLRLRRVLLTVEVGLTVVLLVSAGLLLKSYARLHSADLGCDVSNVLTMRFGLPALRYDNRAKRAEFYRSLLDQVDTLPGVRTAALVSAVPGQGYHGDQGFAIAEHPPLPRGHSQYAISRFADPGYFAALGIPFFHGRTFTPNRETEVIISASFARDYFAGEEPIGKHLLTLGGRALEIVGVVGDTRYLAAAEPRPTMYFPLATGLPDGATLVVRSSADVTTLALPIQRVVQQIDPVLAVSDVLTMRQLINRSTLDASFEALVVFSFAILSLLLAAVGLFGVLSFVVSQRSKEIGIRLAVGAQRRQVLRSLLLDGMHPAFAGLLLGSAAALAAERLIRSVLYGTQALDATVFASVVVVLLLAAAMACALPAWRASRVDPISALRQE